MSVCVLLRLIDLSGEYRFESDDRFVGNESRYIYTFLHARRGELCCVCRALRGRSGGGKGIRDIIARSSSNGREKKIIPKSKEPQECVASPLPLPRLAQQDKHEARHLTSIDPLGRH
jgi:hypothetical protein